MPGLRLRYEQSHAMKVPSPIIHFAPVVILRTELGATIRVEIQRLLSLRPIRGWYW
jgi:hypothetical protein